MTQEGVRQSVEMLNLLLVALSRETERHNSDCACHYCTAAMGAGISHSHLLALLDSGDDEEGK